MEFSNFYDVISKIDGVIHVKLVSENEEIQEMHILANSSRSPKQIVRDIESSLLAAFDYRVDRKVISIAQIETEATKGIGRIKYEGIGVENSGSSISCNIKLSYEGEEFTDTKTALNTSINRNMVVARATISAVEKVLGQPFIFDIHDVVINTSRDITFVTVVINMLINEQVRTIVGSAVALDDINKAIAKATLDAINRIVEKKIS